MKDEDKTKEQLILDLAALRDRCKEESLEHYYDTGTAINALLRLSLEDYSLEELLQRALDIILSVSSLSIETKGSIFLVEDEPEVLIQKVQRGLAEPLLKECARVPFGKCLCGRAASTKRIEFADHIDERHEVSYEGVVPHGHYCVPVLLSGNTIGVINLYLKDGHSRVGREEEFLDSVANTLAGIIKRKRAEEALKQSEERYRQVADFTYAWEYWLAPDGKYIYVSPACERISGYRVEEFLQDPKLLEKITHPDDKRRLAVHIRDVLPGKSGVCELEFRIITRNNEERWIGHECQGVYGRDGAYMGRRGSNRDITDRKKAEGKLLQTLESLRKAVGTTIQVMVSAVEARDPYTAGHQIRSANLAHAIATEMGLPPDRIDGIRMAGSIHDIGKLSIPAEILSKPTKLTNLEFSLIKEHSRIGYEMLKDVESPWPLAEIVYQHHERMDGSGYPRNLKGDEILMEARIMAVADVVESMASHRPYRPALGLNAALAEIENNKGTLYDTDAVDVCLRLFREKDFQLKGA